MPIEIDQSWKLEFTNKQTVLADSLGHAITISSQDKKRLKTYFRIMNKRKMYINQTFAILLAYLIINTFTQTQQYIIDIEYPGQMNTIKDLTIQYLRRLNIPIQPQQIQFNQIGKSSMAHEHAYLTFKKRGKTKIRKISISQVLSLMGSK